MRRLGQASPAKINDLLPGGPQVAWPKLPTQMSLTVLLPGCGQGKCGQSEGELG